MSEIKLREPDPDLIPLLRKCSSEELDNLVGYLTQKGGVSSQLKSTRAYRQWCPDHSKYADEIIAEIQKYGGNTIFNIARGGVGVTYRDIVLKVASRLKVKTAKDEPIDRIEEKLLMKVLEKSWEKMSNKEKKTLIEGIMPETGVDDLPKEFPTALLKAAIIAGGGIVSYRLSLIVAGAVARASLERGIAFVAGTSLARWSAVFAGAVGLGLTALWTLFDVLGPAYRVLVPCVLHISMLRQLHALRDSGLDPQQMPAGSEGTERREILFRKFS
ncbi:hypothetical protein DSCO28_46270 [Desulfosarcina ovata subsp. sediminis]|uniref:DUF3944 domain-containing protein n=1 Tax=Desulfosarcina ovata subsp. sediminis TaxID=885957 RepID=A0A5K7ZV66_9BACT|nr:ubiquinol-cytochrome C chaperone family protein [Desulfosarcina ovata]BBO84061.1 hypothetical protein DSCO28_46270 [Desulfosarcina ovata subsp. sediminis]